MPLELGVEAHQQAATWPLCHPLWHLGQRNILNYFVAYMPAFDVVFQIMKVGNFNDMNQRGKLSDKVYLDSGQIVKETGKKMQKEQLTFELSTWKAKQTWHSLMETLQ